MEIEGGAGAGDRQARLVWAEMDLYEHEEIAAGLLQFEERRIDRDVWRRTSPGAPWILSQGFSGDSQILQRTLRWWNEAIAPFSEVMAWERTADDLVEGRPARVYRLSLAPPAAPAAEGLVTAEAARRKAGRRDEPLSLEGLVFVDAETGNRLLAEVEGRVLHPGLRKGEPDEEVHLVYRESRSITPLPPDVTAPTEGRILDRRAPHPPPLPGTPRRQGGR